MTKKKKIYELFSEKNFMRKEKYNKNFFFQLFILTIKAAFQLAGKIP